MTRAILTCGIVLAALCAQGCVYVNREEKVVSPPPSSAGSEDITIREIDTVSRLAFADNQAAGLKNIARREDLSPEAQVHLVDVTFKRLAFEDMKVDVLITLIKNPNFSEEARSAIIDRINRLAFEGNRMEVLEALSRH